MQRPRACLCRTARGQHVIDEDHRFASDSRRIGYAERAGDRPAPLARTHALEGRRSLRPAKGHRLPGQVQPPGQLARHERRLIETAAPQTGSMQRDRYENRLPVVPAHKRHHVPRHRAGDCDLAAVLQLNRQGPRQFAIGDRRAGPSDARRLRKADAACVDLRRFKGQSACPAAGLTEELDLRPAVGAEAVDILYDRAAPGAPRRQREV